MKVSVVIPCWNMEATLLQTLWSVFRQTERDFEIVLVDDGSTDASVQVALSQNDPRIRIIQQDHAGSASAVNAGIDTARGEFVTIIGADDTIERTYLEEVLAAFSDGVGAVTCHTRYMNESSNIIEAPEYLQNVPKSENRTKEEWRRIFFNAGNCNFACVTYRRYVMLELGGFDQSYKQLNDLEYYLRLIDAGYGISVVEKPLSTFRIRRGQQSEPTPENSDAHIEQLDRIRHKYFFKKTKVMIATPFYENKGYSPYIRSMFQTVYTLARHSTLEFDFVEVSGGSYVDHNRNMIANQFLDTDCTHLLFVDSDQSWDVQGFLNLLKADVDVVGAAYPVKNNWEHYGVTIHTHENGTPIVNEEGLISADKVPTGFMKIHRSVFEKLRQANPDDWYMHGKGVRLYNFFGHLTINHIRYGEDISFGIRWQRIGGKVWLEPRVSMGHYGVQGWYGNYDTYLRKQPGGDLATNEPLHKAA